MTDNRFTYRYKIDKMLNRHGIISITNPNDMLFNSDIERSLFMIEGSEAIEDCDPLSKANTSVVYKNGDSVIVVCEMYTGCVIDSYVIITPSGMTWAWKSEVRLIDE